MFHRGWFLISARDPHLALEAARVVRRFGVARVQPSAEGAPELLAASARWAGCIVEYHAFEEASLMRLREVAPLLPVLVMLREADTRILNRVQSAGMEVVIAPVGEPNLTAFVQRAFAAGFLPDERVARLVSHLAEVRELTAREVQILSFSLGDEPRSRIRRRLGITENTLKTQIRGLLRKCGERNVDALAKNVLRAALLGERPAYEERPVAAWFPQVHSA